MTGIRTHRAAEALNIEARSIVRPFLTWIGPMRDRAIFLETIATRRGPGQPKYLCEAVATASAARAQRAALDAELDGKDPDLVTHPSIVDARQALSAVIERLDQVILRLRQRVKLTQYPERPFLLGVFTTLLQAVGGGDD